VSSWNALLLGRNEYGTWLYAPAGTPVCDPHGRQLDTLQAQARLIPDDQPWVAAWCDDDSTVAEVTTRPQVAGHSIRYRGFGLRVRTDLDGRVDRDATGAYDAAVTDERSGADAAAAVWAEWVALERRMAEGVEPFGQVGRRWFTGITRNALHFVPYNPDWPARFRTARDEILPVLPPGSRVEHFGSTSVPGLAAKDCIDIAVIVPRLDQIEETAEALRPLGYEARPEAFRDPGHVFLRRLTAGRRSHHLHLYREGHQNLIEVLAFRDLLRTDARARQRYETVKRSLAEANPYDRNGYMAGKDAVVDELLRPAMARLRQASESPAVWIAPAGAEPRSAS
jgi:GrpB-like predicted nucleotidyltransferase (UPF0157 family)